MCMLSLSMCAGHGKNCKTAIHSGHKLQFKAWAVGITVMEGCTLGPWRSHVRCVEKLQTGEKMSMGAESHSLTTLVHIMQGWTHANTI